jgi:hypothetical protein
MAKPSPMRAPQAHWLASSSWMRLVDRQQVRTRQDPATDYEVLAARIPQSLRSCLAGVGDAKRNNRNW